jgi:hypothetical protein
VKKYKVFYSQSTETLRQAPQNYLVAHREHNRWVCEPDLAADRELVNVVFNLLLEHEFKYGTGKKLVEHINKTGERDPNGLEKGNWLTILIMFFFLSMALTTGLTNSMYPFLVGLIVLCLRLGYQIFLSIKNKT